MKASLALRIVSIPSFIICCSVFIFNDFYIMEVLSEVDYNDNKEIRYLINICAICGINISILLFNASTLEEKSARRMLKASGLIFAIMTVTLFVTIFSSAIRIPHYILFMVFIYSVFSYAIAYKTEN
ncbi:MAG: hypothetical protein ISP71_06730 [Flavobacteriales bacterium]|nr:hypothetical protein [Flavobacteriales bacterium]